MWEPKLKCWIGSGNPTHLREVLNRSPMKDFFGSVTFEEHHDPLYLLGRWGIHTTIGDSILDLRILIEIEL